MLHPALVELRAQAPRCDGVPEFLGILREAAELAHHALDHDGSGAAEVGSWYAGVLTRLLASPAGAELAGGVRIIPVGDYANGLGLPHLPLRWFAVTPEGETGSDERLAGILSRQGPPPAPLGLGDRRRWGERLAAAARSEDADADLLRIAAADSGEPELCREAPDLAAGLVPRRLAELRPRSLPRHDGLPARGALADVERDVLRPVELIATWCSLSAARVGRPLGPRPVPERLRIGAEVGLLGRADADELSRVWRSGVELLAARWHQGMAGTETTLVELPALERSAYGAAARAVAGHIDALLARAGTGRADDPGAGAGPVE